MAARAEADIARAASSQDLERARIAWLGRRSDLLTRLKGIGSLPADARKDAGARLNAVRGRLEEAIRARRAELETGAGAGPGVDVTFPARPVPTGSPHPITSAIEEMCEIFRSMGFERAEGPELVSERANFDALNTPPDHPARDMQDTFYVDAPPGDGGRWLLRGHTSAVWVKEMERREPPVRIVCPGRAYRRDAADATHSPCFHQVEGLWIDDRCRFSDLKGVLAVFFAAFFGRPVPIRLEPRFFPFTEPSTEVAIECTTCRGKGCQACARSGWLEVLGAGMVHPNILARAGRGYAAPGMRGFAFGIGVERMAMLKHRVADIRWFYENDLRFLAHARE